MTRQHAHKSPASSYLSLALVAALGVTVTTTTAAQKTVNLSDNQTFTADASNTSETTRFDAASRSGVELRIGRNLFSDSEAPIVFPQAKSSIVKILSDGEIKNESDNREAVNYLAGSSLILQNEGNITAGHDAINLDNGVNFTLVNEKNATISSTDRSITINRANGKIINAGAIESSTESAIKKDDIKSANITNTGKISGSKETILLEFTKNSTVTNGGTIESENDTAIRFGGEDSPSFGTRRPAGFQLTNSGIINAKGKYAIRGSYAEDAFIANTADGIIEANEKVVDLGNNIGSILRNEGTVRSSGIHGVYAPSSDNLVIENSGTIQASDKAVVLDKNSRLTNAGRIVAMDANADAIVVEGADNTVILEAGSRVIGDIETTGSNNTLRINVGGARSVMYETTGDWNLEFMDGRPGIEGSVVTAGIGQLETADELMHRQFADLRDSLKRLESTDDPTTNPIQVDAYRGREKRDAGKGHPTLEKYELRTTGLTLALPVELLGIAQPFANYSENALDIDGNAHHIDVQSLRLGLRQPELFRHGALAIGGRVAIGRNFHNGDREVLVNTNGTNASERQTASWRSNIAELAVNANYHQALTSTLRLGISPEFAAQHHRIEGYRESEAFLWKKRSLTQGQAALALTLDYTAEPNTRLNLKARAWHRELLDGETADYRLNTTDVSYTDPMTSDQGLEVGVGMTQKPSDQITIQANLTGYRTKHHTDGAIGSLTLQRRF